MKLATLCYVQKGDQTLMLHRCKRKDDYHLGKWNGLGGKFEPGESPEECAKREILEESGLDVSKLTMRGFLSWPMFDGKDDWYAFVFTAEEFSGELLKDPAEGELAWIPNSELLNLNLWDGDYIFLPWVLEGKFFSGKFTYDNGKLQNHDVVFY